MTTFTEEKKEQEKWVYRPNQNIAHVFNKLVEAEFLAPEQHLVNQEKALTDILQFSATNIPYYADIFKQSGLKVDDVTKLENLIHLPILNKSIIQEQHDNFRPANLPSGEKPAGTSESSGSTGKPLSVYRTDRSRQFEMLMLQRQLRWFKCDPAGTMGWIRKPKELLILPENRPIKDREVLFNKAWPGELGSIFITGPFTAFSLTNTLDSKIEWLKRLKPAYLRTMASELEHLAFAYQGKKPLEGLKTFRAIGEPLTEGMTNRIESTFGIPVYTSYGLDELGWIATKCPEGGRYHVHAERCIVEIIRDDGTHCKPGEYGLVLITMLDNLAMPLIRYNAGDIAQAVDGPCPCGRTLPSIGDIVGRAVEKTVMAPQTLMQVKKLRNAMDLLPDNLSKDVRGYQIHHYESGDFELRIQAVAALSNELKAFFYKEWEVIQGESKSEDTAQPKIIIKQVDQLSRAVSGKFYYFTSDLMPKAALSY